MNTKLNGMRSCNEQLNWETVHLSIKNWKMKIKTGSIAICHGGQAERIELSCYWLICISTRCTSMQNGTTFPDTSWLLCTMSMTLSPSPLVKSSITLEEVSTTSDWDLTLHCLTYLPIVFTSTICMPSVWHHQLTRMNRRKRTNRWNLEMSMSALSTTRCTRTTGSYKLTWLLRMTSKLRGCLARVSQSSM